MNGRRSAAAVKERESLRRALAALPFLCPDCGSDEYQVRWNSGHRRYRIVVFHDGCCPVLANRRLKESVDNFLRDGLVASGHYLSDYNDHDCVGLHWAASR